MDNIRVSHYELRRRLGRGGMGEVYEAFDLKAKRSVALKFVAPELASDADAFKRFESEALNAAALNHPHIATLYEFEPEGERPFIAMELVVGPSLHHRIAAGPFAIHEALEVARDVAAALAYAHRRGIVHRDIKPENLMFDEERRIKVMDFGLARALLASRLTVTGSSLGTPSYMSPESVVQGSGGPAADVFALGLVLVEMLTGKQLFPGDSPLAVMFAIANTDPPPLRTLRPDAPEAVETLVTRTLEKDPERRPDAATVARELAELTGTRLSQLALGTMEPVPAVSSGTRTSTPTVSPTAGTGGVSAERATSGDGTSTPSVADGGRSRKSRAAWILGATVAGAILAVSGVALWNRASAARRAKHLEAVVLNNQAHAALQHGDMAESARLVELALDRDPRFGEALFNRAALYQQEGELDSAAAVYGGLTRTHAKDHKLVAMVLYNLGDIDLQKGAPEQAADHLAQSFAYDSSRWESYNNFGYALVQAQRPAQAIAVLERGSKLFPSAAPLHKNAALALLAVDRESEALAHLDRALLRDSQLASARGLRARLRARAGDRAGALADWKLYVASLPPPEPTERTDVERELIERGVLSAQSAGPP